MSMKTIFYMRWASNGIAFCGVLILTAMLVGIISIDFLQFGNVTGLRVMATVTISACLVSAVLYGLTDWNLVNLNEKE